MDSNINLQTYLIPCMFLFHAQVIYIFIQIFAMCNYVFLIIYEGILNNYDNRSIMFFVLE